eukprot:s358_g24.t1
MSRSANQQTRGSADHAADQRISGSTDQRISKSADRSRDQRISESADQRIPHQQTSRAADQRISQRISGSADQWTSGSADQRISQRISGSASGSADQRISQRISGPADQRISGSASGSADQRISQRISGSASGSAHQRISGPASGSDQPADQRISRSCSGSADRRISGSADQPADQRISGSASGSADQPADQRISQRISGSADQPADQRIKRISGPADQRISGPADQRIGGSADQPADQRIRQPDDHKSNYRIPFRQACILTVNHALMLLETDAECIHTAKRDLPKWAAAGNHIVAACAYPAAFSFKAFAAAAGLRKGCLPKGGECNLEKTLNTLRSLLGEFKVKMHELTPSMRLPLAIASTVRRFVLEETELITAAFQKLWSTEALQVWVDNPLALAGTALRTISFVGERRRILWWRTNMLQSVVDFGLGHLAELVAPRSDFLLTRQGALEELLGGPPAAGLTLVEVGVHLARLAFAILGTHHGLRYIGVDPFAYGEETSPESRLRQLRDLGLSPEEDGGFGAYELSSEVRRAAEYKLNLFGDRAKLLCTWPASETLGSRESPSESVKVRSCEGGVRAAASDFKKLVKRSGSVLENCEAFETDMAVLFAAIFMASEAPVQSRKKIRNLELVLKPLGISEQSTDVICAICLDAGPQGFRKLQCNHAFHLDCIKAWCRQQMKEENFESIQCLQCPMCRSQQQIPLDQQSESCESDGFSVDVEAMTAPVCSVCSFASEEALVFEDTMESLAAKEAELTKEVPQLLETMNRTSEEVNLFERKASEAQERYRKLLEQWSRVYEELRSHYGSSIDRVKPYFEAAATFRSASERVQVVMKEFCAAASQYSQAKADLRNIETRLAYGAHKVRLDRDQQDGLSRATVRVLKCRQDRDRREQDYAESLREYEEAKQACESWRSQLGDALIKRYEPVFRQLQQHQSTLRTERQRIQGFTERAASAPRSENHRSNGSNRCSGESAKGIYNKSLAELDRINVAVHEARALAKEATAVPPPPPPPAPAVPAAAPAAPEEAPEAPEVTVATVATVADKEPQMPQELWLCSGYALVSSGSVPLMLQKKCLPRICHLGRPKTDTEIDQFTSHEELSQDKDVTLEDPLQREVDSLMKLQAQSRAAAEAEAAARSRVDDAVGAEAFAGEASAASVAQALLEEENKELRQELQKRMPQLKAPASLLESSSRSAGTSAEAQARWKLVAFLQVMMVVATAVVLVIMYFGTRNAPKEERPRLRYGTDSGYAKAQGRRFRSPKGVVDEDEEQVLSDLHFARPQEVWTRS